VAQPALSRQIQDLEEEIGFKLFERLPRGVKISAAGKSFLEDARQILQQVNEATLRDRRIARGQSGALRVGFTEKYIMAWGSAEIIPAISPTPAGCGTAPARSLWHFIAPSFR